MDNTKTYQQPTMVLGDSEDDHSEFKLRVENLTKTFGDEVAVEDFSVSVKTGTITSLLGPSGCGKTTTLRCISGLETPDSGKIYIDDKLVSDPENNVHVPPADREVGMVFQSFAIWPHMTVRENILFPFKVQKIGTAEFRENKLNEIIDIIDLEGYEDNLAANLSGGQKQRVTLARALITEPKILLFDEPLSSLDAKLRRKMQHEIKKIQQKLEITSVYVTHDQEEAMFVSDDIALMNNGRLVEENDPLSLYETPREHFSLNFMGRANNIPGTVVSTDGSIVVQTDVGDITFENTNTNLLPSSLELNEQIQISFRPKHCVITPDSEQVADDSLTLHGVIEHKIQVQDYTEYEINTGTVAVSVRSFTDNDHEIGDSVIVSVKPEFIRIFTEEEIGG